MEVPRLWRTKQQRYALVGEVCPRCHSHVFPPRAVCPNCSEQARQQVPFAREQAVLVLDQQPQPVSR